IELITLLFIEAPSVDLVRALLGPTVMFEMNICHGPYRSRTSENRNSVVS
uniref:Uncharacterized protein n=3 Tax=Canis lupus TaxID=9612 RepID=A0A8C0SLR1_CANLF